MLWADENAPDFTGPIEVVGTYESGGKQVELPVRPYTRVWNDAKGSSRPTRELTASLVEKAPFFVVPEQERIEAKAGDKLDVKVKIQAPLAGVHGRTQTPAPVLARQFSDARIERGCRRHGSNGDCRC